MPDQPSVSTHALLPGEELTLTAVVTPIVIPPEIMADRRLIQAHEWDDFEYFNRGEFLCECCGREQMTYRYLYCLNATRDYVGLPFNITSGWRCPKHNDAVSSTGPEGPHTTGEASDNAASFNRAWGLFEILPGPFLGVGLKQNGYNAGRFFHTDLCDYLRGGQRRLWTY